MGTNKLGQDVLSRVIWGARVPLAIVALASSISLVLGLPLGLVSGFYGRYLDRVLVLVMDSIYAFPGLLLAIVVAAIIGPGVVNVSFVIALVYVPTYFRVIRNHVASVKQELGPLAGLSDDIEKVYGGYMESFEKLQARADELAANRRTLNAEVARRMDKWREVIGRLLTDINRDYNDLLTEAEGSGEVRLTDAREVERIGLEILVGFRGTEPKALDSFAQSGGERSIALTAFLLALQRRATSPVRAIDEFDVHLDPHNRELVSKVIIASARAANGVQYVAITPGQVTPPRDVNVLVVQNVGGKSVVSRRR